MSEALKQCCKYRTLILSPLTLRREAAIFHKVGQALNLCVLLFIQISAGLKWAAAAPFDQEGTLGPSTHIPLARI